MRASLLLSDEMPAELDYDAWLRPQSNVFQDEVLGPSKRKLFRAGVPMEHFVSRVGDDLTSAQLKVREGVEIFRKAGPPA